MKSPKNRRMAGVLFLLLVCATVFFVTQSSGSFSLREFRDDLAGSSPGLIAAAAACMVCYVLLEGLSLRHLTGSLGYRRGVLPSAVWSAADIFFSAITPSATGGQPASALCMMRCGVPAAVTTVALLINLAMYTVSILLIGAACAVLRPGMLAGFGTLSHVLIAAGTVIQFGLVAVFFMLVFRKRLAFAIAGWGLRVLTRMRIVKDPDAAQEKLDKVAEEYGACAEVLSGRRGILMRTLGYNVLQRLAMILVSMFVYLAMGGAPGRWLDVCAVQGFVILGSNAIPLPGAVGVADYLYLDGFSGLVEDLVSVELVQRGISFYACVALCGLITWVFLALHRADDQGK